ncbi:hypothetical protein, partial [Nostoc sp.]|uniref:hypothetical protein n=1 Tax=Nostoc sp. TaxID=1180 RepID=UPI002FF4A441
IASTLPQSLFSRKYYLCSFQYFLTNDLGLLYKKTITSIANLLAKRKLFLRLVTFYLLLSLKSPKFQQTEDLSSRKILPI